jgi:tetratricopeptide (TPR) repeat protein
MTRLALISFLALLLTGGAARAQKPAASPNPAQAAGPHMPQAKTKAEFNDYNAAHAITGGAAMEKAADEFAAKYPASELRGFLYSNAMHEYQKENRADKILAMGEKVLTLDANDPVALVMTATVLSDSLNDADNDRQQKIETIKKNAGRALQTVDTGLAPPANASPEQLTAYKNMLRSAAHSALGITALKSADDAEAEKELKAAADINKAAPDGFVLYHLALAQDHQQKYADALATIQNAIRAIRPEDELAKLAQGERERLLKLTK